MHTAEEIMEAIQRLEDTLYGDPSRDKRGVVERVNAVERDLSEIKSGINKVLWWLAAGVVGAGLNLVLNIKNSSEPHPAAPAVTPGK